MSVEVGVDVDDLIGVAAFLARAVRERSVAAADAAAQLAAWSDGDHRALVDARRSVVGDDHETEITLRLLARAAELTTAKPHATCTMHHAEI
jgi:hypothetical protein